MIYGFYQTLRTISEYLKNTSDKVHSIPQNFKIIRAHLFFQIERTGLRIENQLFAAVINDFFRDSKLCESELYQNSFLVFKNVVQSLIQFGDPQF